MSTWSACRECRKLADPWLILVLWIDDEVVWGGSGIKQSCAGYRFEGSHPIFRPTESSPSMPSRDFGTSLTGRVI